MPINECCQQPTNLVEVGKVPAVNGMNPQEKGTLVTRRCSVCNRNHYELEVDPITIDLKE